MQKLSNDAVDDAEITRQLCEVRAIARRLYSERNGSGIELLDLVSWGTEGLLDARRRYEPARGIPFVIFARPRIRGAILDGLRSASALPRAIHRAERLVEGAAGPAHGGVVHDAESVAARRRLGVLASAASIGLLPSTVAGDEGRPEAVAPEEGPEAATARSELARIVEEAIAGLGRAEAEIIHRHIIDGEPIGRIALSLGIGPEQTRRRLRGACAMLRRRLRGPAADWQKVAG